MGRPHPSPSGRAAPAPWCVHLAAQSAHTTCPPTLSTWEGYFWLWHPQQPCPALALSTRPHAVSRACGLLPALLLLQERPVRLWDGSHGSPDEAGRHCRARWPRPQMATLCPVCLQLSQRLPPALLCSSAMLAIQSSQRLQVACKASSLQDAGVWSAHREQARPCRRHTAPACPPGSGTKWGCPSAEF